MIVKVLPRLITFTTILAVHAVIHLKWTYITDILGTVGCSCQNGKYYIALYYALHVLVSKYAREAELYTRYYTDSTILELEAELEKFIDADTIPIIQWIKNKLCFTKRLGL